MTPGAYADRPSRSAHDTDAPRLVTRVRPLDKRPNPVEIYDKAAHNPEFRALWTQRDRQLTLVGLGAAWAITPSGPKGFAHVRNRYRDLVEHADIEGADVPGTGPVALGGFRFDPDANLSPEWSSFSDGMMVVPRVCYAWTPEGCWLTENRLLHANGGSSFSSLGRRASHASTGDVSETSIDQWTASVDNVLNVVRSGAVEKVVVARRTLIRGSEELDIAACLDHLIEAEAQCSVFSFGIGGDTFLGASPEPLVRLSDGKVECICHAGSAPRGSTPEDDTQLGETLVRSAKEEREHYLAARYVEKALRGLCSELTRDPTPRLSKLKNVQHLSTSFHGATRKDRDILQFVEALHPTPAVAGVPTGKALSLIRQLEGMDRGWYSGPVGWMDPAGQGEFAIAIRSGLVTQERAYLYAGAGIVEGSSTDMEYAETELKMLGLKDALGLKPG